MVSYQELYDLLRKEKYSDQLQPLPSNFLREVAIYLEEKKSIVSKDQKSLFSETQKITRKQFENAISLINEFFDVREKKVLNLAFTAAKTGVSKRDAETLLKHEKELFEEVVKKLEDNKIKIAKSLEESEPEKDLKNIFIKFKQEVPKFLDLEGNEVGPFNSGDIANLSSEVANILIEGDKAGKIDEE
jgi:DNA replication initiation complex subunit (GINS family)